MRAAISAIGLLVSCATAAPASGAPWAIGHPAPPFSATLLDGTRLSSADLKGQVVVVNFWATWCVPCKAELPRLDAFYRRNREAGLRVIAVTTEDSVPADRLKPLAALLTLPLVRRFHGSYAPIDGKVPTNFVIDRAGIVRYAAPGAFTLDALNELLIPLLKEPAADAPLASAATLLK